jgi:hypothetical protein
VFESSPCPFSGGSDLERPCGGKEGVGIDTKVRIHCRYVRKYYSFRGWDLGFRVSVPLGNAALLQGEGKGEVE